MHPKQETTTKQLKDQVNSNSKIKGLENKNTTFSKNI
jgi:hypothetical protein